MNAGDINGRNWSQRRLTITAIVLGVAAIVAITAAAVTYRFGDAGSPAASSPGTTTRKPSTLGLGVLYNFARTDDGRAVARLMIYEVVVLPASCLEAGGEPGQAGLAVRYEVDNPGPLTLSIEPNNAEITTIDEAGVSHRTGTPSLAPGCRDYPAAASAAPGRKTAGWVVVSAQPDQAAVRFTPTVWAEDATLKTLPEPYIKLSPTNATVTFPNPLPTRSATATPSPAATESMPTVVPSPSPAPPPPTPAAGRDCDPSLDRWVLGADGGQLKCTYGGSPTPKWVPSLPFVGVQQPGTVCREGASVAESPAGQTLICSSAGDTAHPVWTPEP
ncbi:hypothetical protein [Nocardia colli]|uniref:hypothetical protein n=1 Tax=Nocardia colli TaxID=2545717 RepID=UPI0035DBD7C5